MGIFIVFVLAYALQILLRVSLNTFQVHSVVACFCVSVKFKLGESHLLRIVSGVQFTRTL